MQVEAAQESAVLHIKLLRLYRTALQVPVLLSAPSDVSSKLRFRSVTYLSKAPSKAITARVLLPKLSQSFEVLISPLHVRLSPLA